MRGVLVSSTQNKTRETGEGREASRLTLLSLIFTASQGEAQHGVTVHTAGGTRNDYCYCTRREVLLVSTGSLLPTYIDPGRGPV